MLRKAGRKVVLKVDDLLKHEIFGPSLERWSTREELVQHAAERPEVGAVESWFRPDSKAAASSREKTHEKLDSRPSLKISGLTYSGVPTNDRARGRPCGSARG